MENVGQLIGEPAVRGVVDERLDGGDEGAVTGKPNCIVGPQADDIEAGGFAEGIVTAAVGIAGEVIQELELSKDSEVGAGAESSSGKVAILLRRRCLRRSWGLKERGRIMLEFRLFEYFNRNYNTIARSTGSRPAIAICPVFTELARGVEVRRWRPSKQPVMIAFRFMNTS
jgi:hypothetical protein